MALESTPLFGMMDAKMSWLSQRQRILSQNIANSDTPGYRSRDLAGLNFERELGQQIKRVGLDKTDDNHVGSTREGSDFDVKRSRRPYEFAPDGNGVVVEEQLMKMHETGADHKLSTTLFKKYTALYNIALGSGGK